MNSRTVKTLVATAILLYGFIFFIERRGLDTEGRADYAARVIPELKPVLVTGLEVTFSNQVLRLESQANGWRIISPTPYPAQRNLVESFLDSVVGLSRIAYLSAADVAKQTNGLAGFGLEPPQATVVISQGRMSRELRIGSRTPVSGTLYARVLGQEGVVVTDASLLDKLPASMQAWRDRRLLGDRSSGVDRLEIRRNGLAPVELQRDQAGRRWRITNPLQARADTVFVDQVLEAVQTSQVARFVTDSSVGDESSYGLQPFDVELGFKKGTNEVATLRFGKPVTNDVNLVYAQISESRSILAVDKLISDLLKAPIAQFRDRQLLPFSVADARRIEVQALETFAIEKHPDGSWWGGDKAPFRADKEIVKSILDQLNRLEIVEFLSDVVADYAPFGLTIPARRYRVMIPSAAGSATNIVAADLAVGTNLVDRIVVRRTDEPSVYAAKLSDVLKMPHSAYQVRDRKIWEFSITNVTAVMVTQNGRVMGLARSQNGSWSLPQSLQGFVELSAVLETLYRLGQVEAVNWVAQGSDFFSRLGFNEQAYEIKIETLDGKETRAHTIRFGMRTPHRNVYAAVVFDGEWIVFEFPGDLFKDIASYLNVPETVKQP